jgi:hypothetical protein
VSVYDVYGPVSAVNFFLSFSFPFFSVFQFNRQCVAIYEQTWSRVVKTCCFSASFISR